MHFDAIDARDHRPDRYADTFAGYRAVRMLNDEGDPIGEFVWRLGTGEAVEVTEFGIYREADRRQGRGTQLLDAGIRDIRKFYADKPYAFRRLYLFCDSTNDAGRKFYESQGFTLAATLPEFYHYCDATLYVRDMQA
ncbi:MAG: GNAT family N-acetyltransferase [Planctomycetota bacterium]